MAGKSSKNNVLKLVLLPVPGNATPSKSSHPELVSGSHVSTDAETSSA